MKLSQITVAAIAIIIIACNKDKFTTIPQVEIDSISPETLSSGGILKIKGTYTDKEGDIDSIFIVRKYFAGSTATYVDTIEKIEFATLKVPQSTMEADFQIDFEYNTQQTTLRQLSGVNKDTTAAFGIVLKDKAANRSEYKESEKIRLKKP